MFIHNKWRVYQKSNANHKKRIYWIIGEATVKKVLFVCTGNTFRSMAAEKCLQAFLEKVGDATFIVDSAGTRGNPFGVYEETKEALNSVGVPFSGHNMKRISGSDITSETIVICMTKAHQHIIKERFEVNSYLFNMLAYEVDEDLNDDSETGISPGNSQFADFIKRVVTQINDGIPNLYDALQRL